MAINKRPEQNRNIEEKLLDYGYGSINHMATNYIIKFVDKKFSPMYWVEHTHGSVDYNEMPKLILYAMKKKLCYFYPLTFRSEKYTTLYEKIEKALNKTSDYKLNTQYIDTFEINLDEIEDDAIKMLKLYFEN